jgi:murein DD-endopeptidase MepM/ murein hydrolase activator NlpD
MRPPLLRMRIRTAEFDQRYIGPGVSSRLGSESSPLGGTFGKVRKFGHKVHQGWDLYAALNTPVYAVCCGKVIAVSPHNGALGLTVCLELSSAAAVNVAMRHGSTHLYALYGHLLSTSVVKGAMVTEGQTVAYSGASGNASNTPSHLHFEIRTSPLITPSSDALKNRLDPGELLGYQYYSTSA